MFIRKGTYEKLNQMIDDALSGKFKESDYDETELSKLEVKWKRFISASKLSSDRIEKERANIKELVTDISHQTKTPLSNIMLYSQMLGEQELSEEGKRMAEEIILQSEKLEFLIQSFIKTSRLETGTFQFIMKKNDLGYFVNDTVNRIRKKASEKNIEIHISDDDTVIESSERKPGAVFDLKWTGEAVFNIIDNAVKYSPENSTIEIRIKGTEMFGCIEIQDEGAGIPEEEIPLIFGRFYRGSNVLHEDGIGIGLYLSRQIIEEQGGYIKVESVYGKGSIFKIYLPQ